MSVSFRNISIRYNLISSSDLHLFVLGGVASTKKITGKADVGFVSDKQKTYPAKVTAKTASIPHDAGYVPPNRPTSSYPMQGKGDSYC